MGGEKIEKKKTDNTLSTARIRELKANSKAGGKIWQGSLIHWRSIESSWPWGSTAVSVLLASIGPCTSLLGSSLLLNSTFMRGLPQSPGPLLGHFWSTMKVHEWGAVILSHLEVCRDSVLRTALQLSFEKRLQQDAKARVCFHHWLRKQEWLMCHLFCPSTRSQVLPVSAG